MISEICILSSNYEPLIRKIYRGDVTNVNTTDVFVKKVQEAEDVPLPHFKEDGVFYFYIRRNSLTFMATSISETSPVFVIEILSRLYHIFKDFCGTVTENVIKSNLLLLFEVMDELLDYGYVQLGNTEKLKPYVSSEPPVVSPTRSTQEDVAARLLGIDNRVVPFTAANKPMIRSHSDLENRRNDIFVDVVERLTAVVDANGMVSRLEINGSVNMKNFLIGSPQIKIAVNEDMVINEAGQLKGFGQNVQLDRCNFHQCVKLDDFESERILKVYPPTGEFSIMTYSASGDIPVTLPLRVTATVSDIEASRDIDVKLKVKCEMPANSQAVYVTVRMKVPKHVTSLSQSLQGGLQSAELSREESAVIWKLKKLLGASEAVGKFRLICQGGEKINRKELGPLAVDFEVSGYTSTGFQIRYMRVYDQDHSYVPFRWIRYITVTDSYIVKV